MSRYLCENAENQIFLFLHFEEAKLFFLFIYFYSHSLLNDSKFAKKNQKNKVLYRHNAVVEVFVLTQWTKVSKCFQMNFDDDEIYRLLW